LLFFVDHFVFEKMQFLVTFWLEIAIFLFLTLPKFKLCNFVQLLSPQPSIFSFKITKGFSATLCFAPNFYKFVFPFFNQHVLGKNLAITNKYNTKACKNVQQNTIFPDYIMSEQSINAITWVSIFDHFFFF
jgi:hypothetical protein